MDPHVDAVADDAAERARLPRSGPSGAAKTVDAPDEPSSETKDAPSRVPKNGNRDTASRLRRKQGVKTGTQQAKPGPQRTSARKQKATAKKNEEASERVPRTRRKPVAPAVQQPEPPQQPQSEPEEEAATPDAVEPPRTESAQPPTIQEPAIVEQPPTIQERAIVEEPPTIQERAIVEEPPTIQERAIVEEPFTVERPASTDEPAPRVQAPSEIPPADPVPPGVPAYGPAPAYAGWPAPPEPGPRRLTVPPGVPTAADIAAANVATEWDEREPRDLLGATDLLRAEVAAIPLPLELPGVAHARREHEALLGQLDDYLLPRLRRLDAPLLAVVGGSTGAGKSTLVNSIARREVTRSGVLRPTTRSPVLVHHPYDSGAFLSQRVLPGLARVTSEAPEPAQPIDIDAPRVTALRLVPHDRITPGIAVVDAPDIDSVVEANRELAVQLLASADLWVFVTTSARYGDAVPWHLLTQAVDRGAAVAVVLDRVPEDVMQEVRTHLATLLRDNGLGTSPMFTIPETTLEDGFLPWDLVAPLAGWLRRLALDTRSRDVVVRRTLIGILDSLRERIQIVAAAAEAQADAEASLRADVDAGYDRAHADLHRTLGDGSVVRGEVLGQWQGFVSTGDVFRSLEPGGGRLLDRLAARVRVRVPPAQPLHDALSQGLTSVVLARAGEAQDAIRATWLNRPGGAALLAAVPGLGNVSDGFEDRIARTLREWWMALTELLRAQPRQGRSGAASLGLDGAVAVLTVLAVSRPDDRTPGGPAAVAAAVLGALVGADAVEPLAQTALADLTQRAVELLEGERARALAVLDSLGIRPGRGQALLTRAGVVEESR